MYMYISIVTVVDPHAPGGVKHFDRTAVKRKYEEMEVRGRGGGRERGREGEREGGRESGREGEREGGREGGEEGNYYPHHGPPVGRRHG